MSLLDRIAACNAHDLANFRPFFAGAARVGWVKHDFAETLSRFPDVFAVVDDRVALRDGLDGYAERTAAVDTVLRRLDAEGMFSGWRDEPYPVGGPFAGPHAFEMERTAVPRFGVRAYGVHVNGFVRDPDGKIKMWVARRAYDKPTFPGELDNMIAGGQPVGIDPHANVVKEAGEEAGVPRDLAATARPVGLISYCQETATALKPDVMFSYDLELPADFEPRNTDGEVHAFHLWPIEQVMHVVADTTEFKFNCNLVIIDFCIRHGLIGPEHPDYIDIARGLHR